MTEDQSLQSQKIIAEALIESHCQRVRRQLGPDADPQAQQRPGTSPLQSEVLLELIDHRFQQPTSSFEQLVHAGRILDFLVAALGGEQRVSSLLLPVGLPLLVNEPLFDSFLQEVLYRGRILYERAPRGHARVGMHG